MHPQKKKKTLYNIAKGIQPPPRQPPVDFVISSSAVNLGWILKFPVYNSLPTPPFVVCSSSTCVCLPSPSISLPCLCLLRHLPLLRTTCCPSFLDLGNTYKTQSSNGIGSVLRHHAAITPAAIGRLCEKCKRRDQARNYFFTACYHGMYVVCCSVRQASAMLSCTCTSSCSLLTSGTAIAAASLCCRRQTGASRPLYVRIKAT